MFQTGSMYYNFWDQVVVKSNECITLSSYLGKKIGFLTVINIGLCFIIQTELRDNVQCSKNICNKYINCFTMNLFYSSKN